jgi:cation diffusion facilitator family transporter
MLLLAAVSITLTSLEAIRAPRSGPEPFTLLVLAAVVAIKEALFRNVVKEAASVDSSAVRSDAWHHRSDAITSLSAAIGITVALLGGRGYESADDVAAILAAGIIGWNGWRLLRPALDELMDTAPDDVVRENIRDLARGVTGVNRVEKCIVRKMGYHYFVDMHVEVDPQMTVQQAHNIAHQVKDQVRQKFPAVYDVLVHVEPGQIPPVE